MKYFILLFSMLLSSLSFSQAAQRDGLRVEVLHPISKIRPSEPTNLGVTRVYFEEGEWSGTTCRGDAGDILADDNHILSSVIMAFANRRTLKVEVDDTLPKVNDVCKISAVFVK